MNRRNFLRSVVAFPLIVVAAPFVVKADTEPQWMDFKDQMPTAGKKFELRHNEIGGKVEGKLMEFYTDNPASTGQFITRKSGKSSNKVIRKKDWKWRYIDE